MKVDSHGGIRILTLRRPGGSCMLAASGFQAGSQAGS